MTLKVQRPSSGEIAFDYSLAKKPCHTWYEVVGDLSSNITPLITLHGGPGVCHELLGPLKDLNTQHGIPVIFYDQLGNGQSTRLQEFDGDESFWETSEDMFVQELDNLVNYFGLHNTGFDVYGQSWGGMLAARYASLQPKGLRKLVIANSPASIELILKGEEALRAELPEDVRETIERCEKEGREDSDEYREAMKFWKKTHMCRLEPPLPEELEAAQKHMEEDPTVVTNMWGGDQLKPTGSLKDWTMMNDIEKITAETLLLLGRYDQVQDIAVTPYFERLPRVKWVTLENSSHLGFLEERERYMKVLGGFLAGFP